MDGVVVHVVPGDDGSWEKRLPVLFCFALWNHEALVVISDVVLYRVFLVEAGVAAS